jgi:hypothetical protein
MRLRTSKRRGTSALAVLGVGLGIYVVVATAYHSFIEPAIAKRLPVPPVVALQASIPAARTAADLSGQQALPTHFAPKPKPITAPTTPARVAATPATATDGNADTAEKKPARRQVARSRDESYRQERQQWGSNSSWGGGSWGRGGGGGWNFASGHNNGGSRPWF